jgi:regulator of sigma E protease
MGIVRSIGQGFLGIYDLIRLQIAGLVAALTRTMPLELVGPVGVVHVMYTEAQMGWLRFLNMCALLTVAIGFLNLMPIPPLDGSRLVIVGLEAIRRKPFDKRKEMLVHLVGFVLLLTLIGALTLKDIARIVAGHGILPTP